MLTNTARETCVARNEVKAESFFSRLLGLMGRKKFPAGCDALIFEKCNAIHCFFMRMEIDVIFIDRTGTVTKCVSRVKPWRFAFGGRKSFAVIELPPGTIEATRTFPGDKLSCS